MMTNKLNDFPPWDSESSSKGNFILCLENNSGTGHFSFTYLLSKLLKQQIKVMIISANHSKSHYESILRKQVLSKPEKSYNSLLFVLDFRFSKARIYESVIN